MNLPMPILEGAAMNDHEKMFVDVFVIKPKQDRFREGLQSAKTRKKIVNSLNHSSDINFELATTIPPSSQTPTGIYALLKSKGAPLNCHIVSSNPDLDRSEMDLMLALEEVVGHGDGTFLSCIPGKLGYFESGEMCGRVIFEKP
jgi:hypothetical protein